jgi:AP-2 complex subunit alpha
VKKKAALTLLRLYRKHPDVIPAEEWALRLVSIMDDPDLVSIRYLEIRLRSIFFQGVVVCVTALVMALAQDHLDAFSVCYTKAVDRLNRVRECFQFQFQYAYATIEARNRARIPSYICVL